MSCRQASRRRLAPAGPGELRRRSWPSVRVAPGTSCVGSRHETVGGDSLRGGSCRSVLDPSSSILSGPGGKRRNSPAAGCRPGQRAGNPGAAAVGTIARITSSCRPRPRPGAGRLTPRRLAHCGAADALTPASGKRPVPPHRQPRRWPGGAGWCSNPWSPRRPGCGPRLSARQASTSANRPPRRSRASLSVCSC